MAASSSHAGAAGEGEEEEGGDGEGCWVPYGPRRGLRRLPPPIPSLGRLARARTSDGRLVISREGGAHRVCGRKAEGRLVLGIAESDAAADATALILRRWSHPLAAPDAGAIGGDDEEEEDQAVPVPEEGVRQPPPSPVGSPAGACSDGTIRAASLGAMPTGLARMRA